MINYFDYLVHGGPLAWLLIALSAATVAWILILASGGRRQVLCSPALYGRLVDCLGDGDAAAARAMLAGDGSVLARLVEASLASVELSGSPDRAAGARADRAAEQYARWSWRIAYLPLAAAVAVLVGLLGTVTGLMRAFAGFASVERAVQQAALSAAVSRALVTTFEGLVIAIVAVTAYVILRHRLGLIVLEAGARAAALTELYLAWRRDQAPPASTP